MDYTSRNDLCLARTCEAITADNSRTGKEIIHLIKGTINKGRVSLGVAVIESSLVKVLTGSGFGIRFSKGRFPVFESSLNNYRVMR